MPFQVKAISSTKISTLYHSLDPQSVTQHLAFYQLYPETSEGQLALRDAWSLLTGRKESEWDGAIYTILNASVDAIVSIVNKQSDQSLKILSEETLAAIDKLAAKLPNRSLKGHGALTEEDVLKLPSEEVDLARGLFLTQLGSEEIQKIRSYEAYIDLLALQILVHLPDQASPAMKIREINDFIFNDMGFRFPPHSSYSEDIDIYTFLPSVLDSRRGVCLGVSILYICLAQRLDLSLQMVTPPGHIYVRYRNNGSAEGEINIETTARGIDIPSEEYLSIETRALQERSVKDVIGLAHFNQASVYWGQEKYQEALSAYEKAHRYLPEDKLLMELMAYNYLFTGQEEAGRFLLEKVRNYIPPHAITGETIADDYMQGAVDADGIKALFSQGEESRESLIERRVALETILNKFPRFRSGIFMLAGIWLELHRQDETLATLERYLALEPNDPTVHYYLAELYAERLNYNKAWHHLRRVEALLKPYNHHPKVLVELIRALRTKSPE